MELVEAEAASKRLQNRLLQLQIEREEMELEAAKKRQCVEKASSTPMDPPLPPPPPME
jgi:hypothetical protein